MKKYNELFGIIHEKWHDTCESKIETFDPSEVEPGVPINKCVPPIAFQISMVWSF